MMIEGIFSDNLPSGGELIVTKKNWRVNYPLSSVDNFCDSDTITIPSRKIRSQIKALEDGFSLYQTLVDTMPKDGQFVTKGKGNTNIFVGKYIDGVTFGREWYHFVWSEYLPIDTQEKLDKVIRDLKYCIKKAEVVRKVLFEDEG